MELNGDQRLPAGPTLAWEMLNDVDVLTACVPGAEAFTPNGDNCYDVTMTAAIGPVRARFKGKIEITEPDPPNGYKLKFSGQGATAGFVRGDARVTLAPAGRGETQLTYVASAQIGGRMAQVGSRLVDAAAGAMVEKFFEAFARELAARSGRMTARRPPGLSVWLLLKSFFKRLFSSSV